jgi:hypothetical protein
MGVPPRVVHHVQMRPCVFCGTTEGRPTDEHVIPKWARDAFNIQDGVTIKASDGPGSALEQVGRLRHLNIVLRKQICARCNNEWLAGLERAVQPILSPMALLTEPSVVLDAAAQKLLSLWAVKTALLLELAVRQKYQGRRAVEGYLASPPELAWMWKHNEPPPRSMIWLGCWDCQRAVPVNYEPSAAPLPTAHGAPVPGHLTTLTLGYAAFQIFTTDFVAADHRSADVWNDHVPDSLAHALIRIWPQQPATRDITWPPQPFPRNEWRRLITWDGVLRPGEAHAQPIS